MRRAALDAVARDPVCGVEVEDRKGAVAREHDGERFLFHDAVCADLFDTDPSYYAGKQHEIEAIRRGGVA